MEPFQNKVHVEHKNEYQYKTIDGSNGSFISVSKHKASEQRDGCCEDGQNLDLVVLLVLVRLQVDLKTEQKQ